jgi:lipopolysaccharide transport system permease protein
MEESAMSSVSKTSSERTAKSPRTEEAASAQPKKFTVIEPGARSVTAELTEIVENRDLLVLLVRRDLLVRYVQTVLGLGWGVIQPLVTMVIFTIFFGHLANVNSEGVPYALFSLAALVPWTYFSNGINAAGTSVLNTSTMISKIYFPRLFIPLSPLLAVFVDFLVAFGVLVILMIAYQQTPTPGALALPLLVAVMLLGTFGVGFWLAALGSRYRDVRYVTPFLVQVLLFVTPIVYSASVVPSPWRYVYALNPLVGVVDGFRSGLLGTGPFPWSLVAIGAASSCVLAATGTRYFTRTARYFADLA